MARRMFLDKDIRRIYEPTAVGMEAPGYGCVTYSEVALHDESYDIVYTPFPRHRMR